jgi:FtsZ-binding cell division protein ZapB
MKRLPTEFTDTEMNSLKEIIATATGTDIMNKGRYRNIVDARIVFSKIIRERGYTYSSIARYLSKDHSTIIHYICECNHLIQTDDKMMETYIACRNKFLEDKDALLTYTDKDAVKEMVILKMDIEKLIDKNNRLKNTQNKYDRLSEIINIIDKRTPEGKEHEVKQEITRMFNGL